VANKPGRPVHSRSKQPLRHCNQQSHCGHGDAEIALRIGNSVRLTVPVDSNATLNATASGALPITFQWLYGTSVLPGATNSSLVLSHVRTNDAGRYSVSVKNAYGTGLSQPASLTVVPNVTATAKGSALGLAHGFHLADNLACVAAGLSGLVILDISDPRKLYGWACETPGEPWASRFRRLRVCSGFVWEYEVIDVHNPAFPSWSPPFRLPSIQTKSPSGKTLRIWVV
jgi:hypothetical protein